MGVALAMVAGIAIIFGEIGFRLFKPQDLSGSFRYADEIGIQVHRPGTKCQHQLLERIVHYEFREDGLREMGTPEGKKKILVMGDSVTFGWLLGAEDTTLKHLQNRLDAQHGVGEIELLNAGHGGWGASDYVRYFEEYGSNYDIMGVIAFLGADDIGRSVTAGQYALSEDGKSLVKKYGVHKNSFIKRTLNATPGYQWMLQNSHIFQSVRRAMIPNRPQEFAVDHSAQNKRVETPDPNSKINRYGSLLYAHLKSMTDERGIPLMILTNGGSQGDKVPYMSKHFYRIADQLLGALDIEFHDISIDGEKVFRAAGEPTSIENDGHPNELGASISAELNWPYVKKFAEKCLENSSN